MCLIEPYGFTQHLSETENTHSARHVRLYVYVEPLGYITQGIYREGQPYKALEDALIEPLI